MSLETSGRSEGILQKLLQLRWQRDVIERWMLCPEIATESREQLQEMLSRVERELQVLNAARHMD